MIGPAMAAMVYHFPCGCGGIIGHMCSFCGYFWQLNDGFLRIRNFIVT
jgi:hypothetical protein